MLWKSLLKNKSAWIVLFSAAGIAAAILPASWTALPEHVQQAFLIAVLVVGGIPMFIDIAKDLLRGELGADALAIVSIITSFILKEYLAGAILVLMLSGGSLLETYA